MINRVVLLHWRRCIEVQGGLKSLMVPPATRRYVYCVEHAKSWIDCFATCYVVSFGFHQLSRDINQERPIISGMRNHC